MTNHKKINQINKKGFTLIELMIGVTIVGILSALAIPAYQDYVIKAEIAEGISLSGGAKIFITDYYTQKGVFPVNSNEAILPETNGAYIANLEIDNYIININFNEKAHNVLNGQKILITPTITEKGNIKFVCSSDIQGKYLPVSCR